MRSSPSILAGGLALILGALAFIGVFTYLAATFDYPKVLDGTADRVLPALLATGASGRFAWSLYALLPLIWLPAGAGAFQALRARSEGGMRLAMLFAVLAAITMMIGLLRWPSIHWELARAWAVAPVAGANNYLLPLWMIGFGVALIRYGQPRDSGMRIESERRA